MRNETKVILYLLVFACFMKFLFPFNSFLYDDEHKDVDGVFYLAKYDSFFYLNEINNGEIKNTLSFIGIGLKSLFRTNLPLYWLPAIFGVLNCILFYFVARKLYAVFPSVVASLLFLLHPYSFFSTFKGYYDTNFLIVTLVLLLLYCLLIKDWVGAIIILVVFSFTWNGWYIFLLFSVVCFGLYQVLYKKKYWYLIFPVLAFIFFWKKALAKITSYNSMRMVSELTSYDFSIKVDMILIPILSILVLIMIVYFVRYYGVKETLKYKMLIVVAGFCIFLILSLGMVRFFYLFIIFYSLILGYLIALIDKKYFVVCLTVLAVIFCVLAFDADYNRKTIIMEDSVVERVSVLDGCIDSSWDFGSMYQAYTKAKVLQKGSPHNFNRFATGLLLPEDEGLKFFNKGCYIIINSYDIKKMEVYSNLSGIPISADSFFNQDSYNYYTNIGFSKGRYINVVVLKRKI